MILAVNRHHFRGERFDARALFANENVMGAGDVCDQVGERLVLPVLSGARRCGGRALLQTVQSFVDGDFCFGAGLAEGAAPATAVIDSKLFEFARRIRHFNGEFADGLGGRNCHVLVSFLRFTDTGRYCRHVFTVEGQSGGDYHFCHGDDGIARITTQNRDDSMSWDKSTYEKSDQPRLLLLRLNWKLSNYATDLSMKSSQVTAT